MRIPDYRNVHGIKDPNYWVPKANRVDQAHEDEFEKELEDSIHKRKSEAKRRRKKILTSNEELTEVELEVDRLLDEYEQKVKWETDIDIDLDKETPNDNGQFSGWG